MKTIVWLFLLTAGLAWGVPGLRAETNKVHLTDEQMGDLLQQAVLLAKFGLYGEAEARCRQILAAKPDQPTVLQLLQEIQAKRRAQDPSAGLQARLDQLILPTVNFREADPLAVVEYLREQTKKLSPDKTPVNIVWLVPAGAKLPRVTLQLQKIPFLDVVRYTTQAAGLRYRVEPYAVVIFKQTPPAAPPPPPPESNVQSQ